MTGRDHNKLLSIFFFVYGGIQLLIGGFVVLMYGGIGAFMMSQAHKSDEQAAGGFLLVFALIVGLFVLIFAGFTLLTAWKMLKQKPKAKVFGIIASIVSLLNFPLGTALGVYGLWFLFGDQGRQFYDGGGNMTGYNSPPPPPNYWQ